MLLGRRKFCIDDDIHLVSDKVGQELGAQAKVRALHGAFQTETGCHDLRHRAHLMGNEPGIKHNSLGNVPDGERAIQLAMSLGYHHSLSGLEGHRGIYFSIEEVG